MSSESSSGTGAFSPFEAAVYTADQLAIVSQQLNLPQEVTEKLAAIEGVSAPQEQKIKAEEATKVVGAYIAEVRSESEAVAKLVHNAVGVPFEVLRQQINKRCREQLPRREVPYEVARETIEAMLYAAIRKATGAEHKKVNDIEGFEDEVKLVVACLLDAEGQGHGTHGVLRILRYIEAIEGGALNPSGKVEYTRMALDRGECVGNRTFGQVCVQVALQNALRELEENGDIDTFTVTGREMQHAGRLEWIVRQAVRKGYAASAMFNTEGWGRTPPIDGMEPKWGTDPVAYGVVTGEEGSDGVVCDTSTTAWAEGLVKECDVNGVEVPPGVIRLADGTPTTNAGDLYGDRPGLLLPLGGPIAEHKGVALGVGVELFTHQMSLGKITEGDRPPSFVGNNSYLYLSRTTEEQRALAARRLAQIEECPTTTGEPVRVPGKRGLELLAEAKAGVLRIPETSWGEIEGKHRELCGGASA